MNEPLQLGKIYEVKCMSFVSHSGISAYLPVLGEIHKDNLAGIEHIHIDNRFLSNQEMKDFQLSTRDLNIMAAEKDRDLYYKTRYEKRPCRRHWEHLPYPISKERIEFEKNHDKYKINIKKPVCPHLNFDLSETEIIDGVITCPIHSLRWCAKTGNHMGRKKV